jgi:chemotaxis response regulator CheB
MFVFLIDKNPLISQWLKRQADARGVQFYSLSSLAEAAYFINDLKPDVLVIDGQSIEGADVFLTKLNEFPFAKTLPVVGLGVTLPEWIGEFDFKGQLKKPLNPEHFHAEVERLVKS